MSVALAPLRLLLGARLLKEKNTYTPLELVASLHMQQSLWRTLQIRSRIPLHHRNLDSATEREELIVFCIIGNGVFEVYLIISSPLISSHIIFYRKPASKHHLWFLHLEEVVQEQERLI